MKPYRADKGVQLDASFLLHQSAYEKCRGFAGDSAGMAKLCLEGSILWKRENLVPTERPERSQHYASKEQLRRETRYK